MDKTFKVLITEKYVYEIEFHAKSKLEAIQKAKEFYENPDDGVFTADGCSFDEVEFHIKN